MSGVLIVNCEVADRPGTAVRVRDGRIVEVGTGLRSQGGESVLDARGGAVIPGLHDHHVHLRSAVAARESVALDPASVTAAGGLAAAIRAAAAGLVPGAWLRAVGAHGTEIEALDRVRLDAILADRPVRIQHRGGALWLLNSAGIARLGVEGWIDAGVERFADGSATGRLWRVDDRVHTVLADDRGDQARGLAELSRDALVIGVTGFTDATAGRTAADIEDLAAHVAAGRIRQRLTLMADPALQAPEGSTVRIGPCKIVLDDDRLPDDAKLAEIVSAAHSAEAPVAVHCVTAEQLVVTMAALEASGVREGDRIEHAGLVPPGYARTMAALGITVVTQPGFIAARGDDYLRDVPAPEQPWLYPCRSLMAEGVTVAGSSDAPFGPLDPWLAMATAVTRRAASGRVVGADERVGARTALELYLGTAQAPARARRVAVGEPGELCVLREPMSVVLADLGAHQVAAVTIDDEVIDCPR